LGALLEDRLHQRARGPQPLLRQSVPSSLVQPISTSGEEVSLCRSLEMIHR
jgi:hypothetical protein